MKKALRQIALTYRDGLSPGDISRQSQRISTHITTLLQTFSCCTVGLFYPVRGEPNLLDLMADPALSKIRWALPVCTDSPQGPVLSFAFYSTGQVLEKGRYDIPVPLHKEWVNPDLLIIPCLAFHREGARLGYGAGWYDRTLSQLAVQPVCVGVAYSATEQDQPFSETHDYLLNYIITEIEIIRCGPNRQ